MPGEVVKLAGAGVLGRDVEQKAQSPGKTEAASYTWLRICKNADQMSPDLTVI